MSEVLRERAAEGVAVDLLLAPARARGAPVRRRRDRQPRAHRRGRGRRGAAEPALAAAPARGGRRRPATGSDGVPGATLVGGANGAVLVELTMVRTTSSCSTRRAAPDGCGASSRLARRSPSSSARWSSDEPARGPRWLVARREFSERIRSRAFQISLVVTVLVVAAVGIVAGVVGDDRPEEYTVGAVGRRGSRRWPAPPVRRAAALDVRIKVEGAPSAAAARAGVRDESLDAALVDDVIVTLKEPPDELAQALQAGARRVRAGAELRSEGLSGDGGAPCARPAAAAHRGARGRRRGRRGRRLRGVARALPAADHVRDRGRLGGGRGEVLARDRGAARDGRAARHPRREDPRHRRTGAAAARR